MKKSKSKRKDKSSINGEIASSCRKSLRVADQSREKIDDNNCWDDDDDDLDE